MKYKNIHIIINPASGAKQFILQNINKCFENTSINWDVSVIHHCNDIQAIIQSKISSTDLLAVYGGDGTIVKAAAALLSSDVPLAIIPGGTANVIAKELGIPLDCIDAINLMKNGNNEIRKVDTGIMNKVPFLIRVNFGLLAKMVRNADRQLKDDFGQMAYGIATTHSLIENQKPIMYKMVIDGNEVNETGVSLTVTNMGSIGFSGFSFLPNISIEDGKLDVILMKDSDFFSLLRIAGTTLLHTESDVLKRWKCKEILIKFNQIKKFMCDDKEEKEKIIHIKVNPKSLRVLVPKHNKN